MLRKFRDFIFGDVSKISQVHEQNPDEEYVQELKLVCRKCKQQIGYMVNTNGQYYRINPQSAGVSRISCGNNEVNDFLCSECFANTKGDS